MNNDERSPLPLTSRVTYSDLLDPCLRRTKTLNRFVAYPGVTSQTRSHGRRNGEEIGYAGMMIDGCCRSKSRVFYKMVICFVQKGWICPAPRARSLVRGRVLIRIVNYLETQVVCYKLLFCCFVSIVSEAYVDKKGEQTSQKNPRCQ